MASKLSKNSPAVKLLRSKFDRGLVTPDMTPADVRETEPLFKAHKPTNWRTCFNNMKKEYEIENSGILLLFLYRFYNFFYCFIFLFKFIHFN